MFLNLVETLKYRPSNCHDQSFIVYHSFTHKLVDNQALRAYAENVYHCDLDLSKTIHHFPYGPGNAVSKSDEMKRNLSILKGRTISGHIDTAKAYIE